jgi:hypothetical protein
VKRRVFTSARAAAAVSPELPLETHEAEMAEPPAPDEASPPPETSTAKAVAQRHITVDKDGFVTHIDGRKIL